MKAPSFRCSEGPEPGSLILHYYSDRPGLESIVIGIVKVSTKLLFTPDARIIRLATSFHFLMGCHLSCGRLLSLNGLEINEYHVGRGS